MTFVETGLVFMAAAILPGLPGASGGGTTDTDTGKGTGTGNSAADEIRAARAGFNTAIADGNIDAIGKILAENTVLVAGTDSAVISGRRDQLDVWRQDFADETRLVFRRTPDKVTVSPLYPMAMETGTWRGAVAGNERDWIGGSYVAKWRRIDGRWQIEAETYMTASCGGRLCDG